LRYWIEKIDQGFRTMGLITRDDSPNTPPKCVFKMEKALYLVFHEIEYKRLDKIEIGFNCSVGLSDGAPT